MQRSGKPRVTVVVPTRNEARNLEVVLPAIAAVRPAVHEIIVVDGHSVDNSVETARRVLPGCGRSPRPARAKATPWPAASPPPPATSSSCSTPTAPPTPPKSPPSSPPSSPAPTSPKAPASPPAAAATTSPCSAAPATPASTASPTPCSAPATPTSATATTPSGPTCSPARPPRPHHPRTPRRHALGRRLRNRNRPQLPHRRRRPPHRQVPSVERQRIFGRTNLRTFTDGTRVLRTLAAERRRAVQLRARGVGRRAPRFDTVGTPACAGNAYGPESYSPDYGSDLYEGRGLRPDRFGTERRGEPALTPAGGIAVTPREPRDGTGEPGSGRAVRPAARPHERPGTRGGHPGEP